MSDMVSSKDRGVLQGYNSLVFALGIAVGAPLGGVLADTLGWRWAFALQVIYDPKIPTDGSRSLF